MEFLSIVVIIVVKQNYFISIFNTFFNQRKEIKSIKKLMVHQLDTSLFFLMTFNRHSFASDATQT